jgi:hypothetical protein
MVFGCSAWLSCIRSMVGDAGLDACPDTFKTTIMLIVARDSSVQMILFFIMYQCGCT